MPQIFVYQTTSQVLIEHDQLFLVLFYLLTLFYLQPFHAYLAIPYQ